MNFLFLKVCPLRPVLRFVSQMANGYGGYNFSDISISGQHNGFQPRLDTISSLGNFSSGSHGINDSSHGTEIRQLLAQITVLERDLAVQKCGFIYFFVHICADSRCTELLMHNYKFN